MLQTTTKFAEGAERVAKALCEYLQIPYSQTHMLDKVPIERKSKVLAMDGFTSSRSTSPCAGILEPISQVVHRISRALDLLREILLPSLEGLSYTKMGNVTGKIANASLIDLSCSLIDDSEVHPTISGNAKVLDELRQIVRSVQTD